MSVFSGISLLVIAVGCLFFAAGSSGMLRFPDVYVRLHAITKADNLGLGLVILGVLLQVDSLFDAAKLILTWLLVMLTSSTTCHLIAQSALRSGVGPWGQRGASRQ